MCQEKTHTCMEYVNVIWEGPDHESIPPSSVLGKTFFCTLTILTRHILFDIYWTADKSFVVHDCHRVAIVYIASCNMNSSGAYGFLFNMGKYCHAIHYCLFQY